MACTTPIDELLENAKCFMCLNEHQLQAISVSLLCDLNENGLSGQIPNAHTDVVTPQVTASATLVDIPGSSIFVTLTTTTDIQAYMTYAAQSALPGNSDCVGAFAISINGIDSDEMQLYFISTEARLIGAVVHASSALPPGTYEIKGRFRRVSGTLSIQVTALQISAIGMESNTA